MKRRLDKDQLNNLSESQKVNLRKLWNIEISDGVLLLGTIYYIKNEHEKDLFLKIKSSILPLLDIGQIIEMLFIKKVYYDLGLVTENVCDDLWELLKPLLLK